MSKRKYFLDEDGLDALWSKIKSKIASSVESVQTEFEGTVSELDSRISQNESDIVELRDLYESIDLPDLSNLPDDVSYNGEKIQLYHNNSPIGDGFLAEDILADSKTISDIRGNISGLDGKYTDLEKRLDSLNPCDCEALVNIKKSEDGKYIVEEDERDNAVTAESIINTLNEIVGGFKPSDLSNYYTRKESDDKFIAGSNIISEEEITVIFG